MSAGSPAQEAISRELRQAVELLQHDIARVEFWANALQDFAKPIPDYDPSRSRLNEFVLPRRGLQAARD